MTQRVNPPVAWIRLSMGAPISAFAAVLFRKSPHVRSLAIHILCELIEGNITLYIYHWNKRKNNQHIFNPSNNCGLSELQRFSWGHPYWMQRTNAILSHVKESCARWHFSAWHPSSGLHVSEASIGYIRSKHRLIHWLLWVDWVVSTTCLQNLQMSTILLDDTGWKKKVSIVQNTTASRGS